jgi:ATP-dependent DNA helicase RecQ
VQHPELTLAAGAEVHRAYQPHGDVKLARIKTMHGTIVTTAPETLPQVQPEPEMAAGTRVVHQRFGPGKVKDVHNGVALVHFTKGGDKKVKVEYLSA